MKCIDILKELNLAETKIDNAIEELTEIKNIFSSAKDVLEFYEKIKSEKNDNM